MINNFRGKYFFLSNFYECEVTFEGITYQNTEAAFHAQKTLNVEERKKFATLNPSEAKKAGRKLNLRSDWEVIKTRVMYDVCKAKFLQNPELKKKLLETGTEYLEEGNDWGDYFWGTVNGVGENRLGYILMQIRDELRRNRLTKEKK
jgi:ribA/ribD-fused uncharacterized protein